MKNTNFTLALPLLLTLLFILSVPCMNYAEENISRSRQRALARIEPALEGLDNFLDATPDLPQNNSALIKTAINKTNSLLHENTITHDQTWKDYHNEIVILYNDLKKAGADKAVLNNIRDLKEASSVDGLLLTVTGITTVFAGLILLALIFSFIPRVIGPRQAYLKDTPAQKEILKVSSAALTGEEISAISTALYMHLNVYQEEQKQILTWDKKFRRFSPWNMSGRLSINQKNRQIY